MPAGVDKRTPKNRPTRLYDAANGRLAGAKTESDRSHGTGRVYVYTDANGRGSYYGQWRVGAAPARKSPR